MSYAKMKYTQSPIQVHGMELSHDEVRRIAELAKLDLTDDEVVLYAGQLSHILGYFQKLQDVDTSQVSPTASVLPLKNVFRPDVAAQPLAPDAVIANAPDSEDHQFRVSAVLGDE
jgi:aspartyl-tRNA(Asn)/glutamyl-tRNA(Gln) amidotransferase subunit C